MALSKRARTWLRRFIAWSVTIGVVAFLLTRYSPSEIGAALVRGNWAGMIPILLVASLWGLVFMTTADWVVFSRGLGKMRWFEALRGKAGSSVVQAFNHTVGQGAYGVWVARLTRSSLQETIGVIGYVILTDLVALFAVAAAAVWLADASALPRAELLRWLAPAVVAGLTAGAFVGPHILPRIFRRAVLLEPWKRISPEVFLLIVFTRAIAITGVMLAIALSARVFGLAVPASALLVYLPIIFIAAGLPINVLGFGAVQLVWVAAFESFAPGEHILAFQLLVQVIGLAAFIVRGLPFLPSVLRDVTRARE